MKFYKLIFFVVVSIMFNTTLTAQKDCFKNISIDEWNFNFCLSEKMAISTRQGAYIITDYQNYFNGEENYSVKISVHYNTDSYDAKRLLNDLDIEKSYHSYNEIGSLDSIYTSENISYYIKHKKYEDSINWTAAVICYKTQYYVLRFQNILAEIDPFLAISDVVGRFEFSGKPRIGDYEGITEEFKTKFIMGIKDKSIVDSFLMTVDLMFVINDLVPEDEKGSEQEFKEFIPTIDSMINESKICLQKIMEHDSVCLKEFIFEVDAETFPVYIFQCYAKLEIEGIIKTYAIAFTEFNGNIKLMGIQER